MKRLLLLSAIIYICINSRVHGVEPPGSAVVIDIAGQFSSKTSDISTNPPSGAFPIPALLGGTFTGSFSYRTDITGGSVGGSLYRNFSLTTTSVNVFGNTGALIHTITFPTPIDDNDVRVFDGSMRVYLGSSAPSDSGWLPRMPTDMRFVLYGNSFLRSNDTAPNAAVLNSSSIYFPSSPVIIFSPTVDLPFVALDDTATAGGWILPIVSMSLSAHDVAIPEPTSAALLAFAVLAALPTRRRKSVPHNRF